MPLWAPELQLDLRAVSRSRAHQGLAHGLVNLLEDHVPLEVRAAEQRAEVNAAGQFHLPNPCGKATEAQPNLRGLSSSSETLSQHLEK